jgi:hypothetical protein
MRKNKTVTIHGEKIVVYELTDLQVHDFFMDLDRGLVGTHVRDRYMQPSKVIPFSLVESSCEGVNVNTLIRDQGWLQSEVGELYDAVLEVNDFLSKGLAMMTAIGQAMKTVELMTAGSGKPSSS